MRHELWSGGWQTVTDGQLAGPDGRIYRRRSTRARRADVEALVEAGAPLVVYWFGGRRLDWHDGTDAADCWAEVRRDVTTEPSRPARSGGPRWHAGRWEGEDGSVLVLLTGRC